MKARKIIIPAGVDPVPNKMELSAASLLAEFFGADVRFVPRASNHTADFEIQGKVWEMKSPKGDGKHNLEHQFSRAGKQSRHMVLDARRSKMHMAKIRSQATLLFRHSRVIERLVLIDKQGRVTEIEK